MTDTGTTGTVVFSLLLLLTLGAWAPCAAEYVWFDETAGARGYADFDALAASYQAFMGEPSAVITFDDLPTGTRLGDQYANSLGVTFANTAHGRWASMSGVQAEGGSLVEDVTGYDGSYMPDGNRLYAKFDNDVPGKPLTISFDEPVVSVGAFVGMGVQGGVHSLTVSVYDEDNKLLGAKTVESWLWEGDGDGQNFESFFGLRSDEAAISRIEILNNATTDYANGLLLDNVAFYSDPVPEPSTLVLCLGGAGMLLWRRASGRRVK